MNLSIISTKEVYGFNMIFMVIFWIVYFAVLVYYFFIRKYVKKYETNDAIIAGLTMLAFSFFIVGLVTKDPIFSTIGVPKEYEWVVGLFLSFFTAWKFYFDPIKKRITQLEQHFVEFFGIANTKFEHIEKGIDEIKKGLK
jgi:hypothetical protein